MLAKLSETMKAEAATTHGVEVIYIERKRSRKPDYNFIKGRV